MKYGILTYHSLPNWGAVLQSYALCKTIKKLGVECELVDYECKKIDQSEFSFHYGRNLIKSLLRRLIIWPHNEKKIIACRDFEKEIRSNKRYTHDTINTANNLYDGFITGSDQVWNLSLNGYDDTYYLSFVEKNKKKISYAASIGYDLDDVDWDRLGDALSTFDKVSVRESDTSEEIHKRFDIDCLNVPDPTMLFSSEEWDEYTHDVEDNNYVLVYYPYKAILNAAKKYSKRMNKKLIVLQNPFFTDLFCGKELYSPCEFLSYIKYADAIFTDSYHGLLFSLYFHKKVWTNNNGNRVKSLLHEFNLDKCYISNDLYFKNRIDYKQVDKCMIRKRKIGLDFISEAIE